MNRSCKEKGCEIITQTGRIRCHEHDHRPIVEKNPTAAIAKLTQIQQPIKSDYWIDFIQNNISDQTMAKEITALIEVGVATVNLVRAESVYGIRQQLMGNASNALRESTRTAKKFNELLMNK